MNASSSFWTFSANTGSACGGGGGAGGSETLCGTGGAVGRRQKLSDATEDRWLDVSASGARAGGGVDVDDPEAADEVVDSWDTWDCCESPESWRVMEDQPREMLDDVGGFAHSVGVLDQNDMTGLGG